MDINRRFPCIDFMETAARRRIPRFAWNYLADGIGRERVLAENIERLDRVKLTPRYLVADADHPDSSHELFGVNYAAPFGVAPLGLGGLVWPRAAEHLALEGDRARGNRHLSCRKRRSGLHPATEDL